MQTFETIAKLVAPVLAVVMAIVAYIKYRKIRFSESKLEIKISPETYLSYHSTIVKISIQMINKGNTVIKAIENRCFFELKKLPSEIENEFSLFDINELDNLSPSPIHFLIEEYGPTDSKKPYLIEPSVTDDVQIIFSTKYRGLLVLRVIFEDIEGYKWTSKEIVSISDFK